MPGEICDAGKLTGCTHDCLGVADGWQCSGGDSESPSVCN